jgi:hypothetical protein
LFHLLQYTRGIWARATHRSTGLGLRLYRGGQYNFDFLAIQTFMKANRCVTIRAYVGNGRRFLLAADQLSVLIDPPSGSTLGADQPSVRINHVSQTLTQLPGESEVGSFKRAGND